MFVQPYGQIGGAERYLQTLLRLLPPGTVDRVVCLQHGNFPAQLRMEGYDIELMETGPSPVDILRSGLRLRRSLRRTRPAVIHANGLKGALVAGVAALGTGIPVVWVKHDFSWDGRVAWIGARLATRIIGVSDAATGAFDPAVRRRKVRTVYNGTEIADIDRATGRRVLLDAVGAAEPAQVVSLVGRLHPVKGHVEVLAVARQLTERFPDLRFAFVGGDDPNNLDHGALLRARTRELDLDHCVRFLGFRDDVAAIVAGSDVVVVPSGVDDRGMGKEAFPLAALEALSLGVPVVAYADGGVSELVGDCGLLVAPGDRAGLADAIATVLDDPSTAAGVAARGQERVRTRFSLCSMVEGTLAVYDEAVSER